MNSGFSVIFEEDKLKLDSRLETSEIIYEKYRQRRLEGKIRSKFLFVASTILAISTVVLIAFFQYDEYKAYVNKRFDHINSTRLFCNKTEISNIDIISTPISIFLIIIFTFMFKRRVFLRDRFKYRNIGLPMIVSLWNKSDRLLSSFTFGLIAFNVFGIVKSSFNGEVNAKLIPIKDPSGILSLLFKIGDMFLIGIRYYPVLVSFRINSFFVNFITCIYMWIDYLENIYQYGKCESIITKTGFHFEKEYSNENLNEKLPYFMIYKILSAIPLSIFSSVIAIMLTFRSIINLIDFLLSCKSPLIKEEMKYKNMDSFCHLLFGINDEHELIYSRYDIDYVIELLKTKNLYNENISTRFLNYYNKSPISDSIKHSAKLNRSKYYNIKQKSNETKLVKFVKNLVRNYIYDWDPTFRFTSRFLNTIIVANVALYYFFVYFLYFIYEAFASWLGEYIEDIIRNAIKNGVNIGQFMCELSEHLCIYGLKEVGYIQLPIPNRVKQTLTWSYPNLKESITAILIIPIFMSVLICFFQIINLVKETRLHLRELYKGKCEFVVSTKHLKNSNFAGASFHFGGFVVGYFIWGFFTIYLFGLIVGIIIMTIRMFIGDMVFKDIALKSIPTLTLFAFKLLANKIASNFVFLNRKSKILALDNFRAFNIYLFFNFFFDCFMGFLSALIRLINALIASILMMPRLSYSFMGRQLETVDNGYSCFSGFLHMEAMHTNPIIICFCSVLYYKHLAEHIRRYKTKKRDLNLNEQESDELFIKLAKFNGRISISEPSELLTLSNMYISLNKKRLYKKYIVNRWHLWLRLNLNKELMSYRKYLYQSNNNLIILARF